MTFIATLTFTLWLVTSSGTTPVGSFTGPAQMAQDSCKIAEAAWTARLKQPPRAVLATMVCGISVEVTARPSDPSM